MPSNIVNLEDVVPGIGGVTFVTPDGGEFSVPGDLPTDTTFELLGLFEDLIKFQENASAQIAKKASANVVAKIRSDLKDVTDMIDAKLLAIFQINQPDLDSLPFGAKSTNYILGEIFAMVGLASKEGGIGELPVPPTPPAREGNKPKTTPAKRKR